MHERQPLWLLVTIAMSIISVVLIVNGRHSPNVTQLASQTLPKNCLTDGEVSYALASLSFGKYQEQQQAVARLKGNALRSTVCREYVIRRLMLAMDQPKLDLTGGTPQFFIWHYGTQLLGQLKAVEALDLLIANFHLHDGSGFPFNHYPALAGVIDMGEVALPKLRIVLQEHSDRFTRRLAVFCIAQIGGRSADAILKEAVNTEPDPCVASCIQATLKEFRNKRRPQNISDTGRTEWYTTFLCDGT